MTNAAPVPHVHSLGVDHASLGTLVPLGVTGLGTAAAGPLKLHFVGVYTGDDRSSHPVDTEQDATVAGASTLNWTSFGPFNAELLGGAMVTGQFAGTIAVKAYNLDGTVDEDQGPSSFTFRVDPSIWVDTFEPISANCDGAAKRAFGGALYRLRARAIGFTPDESKGFTYQISTPEVRYNATLPGFEFVLAKGGVAFPTRTFTHTPTGTTDLIESQPGDLDHAISFPPLPDGVVSYGSKILINAADKDTGRAVGSTLGIAVHNTLEYFYDGRTRLAQTTAPEAVSGCLAGGEGKNGGPGKSVPYTENATETRARVYEVAYDKNWLFQLGATDAPGADNAWSTTDGQTYQHSAYDTSGWEGSSYLPGGRLKPTNNQWRMTYDGATGTVTPRDASLDAYSPSKGASGFASPIHIPHLPSPMNGGIEGDFLAWSNGNLIDPTTNTRTLDSSGATAPADSSTGGLSIAESEQLLGSTATTDAAHVLVVRVVGGGVSSPTGEDNVLSAAVGASIQNMDPWQVSSSVTVDGSIDGLIAPGKAGVWYRQAVKLVRHSYLLSYDKCGDAPVVGEVTFTDWFWGRDLAVGSAQACGAGELPPTGLAAAVCIEGDCADDLVSKVPARAGAHDLARARATKSATLDLRPAASK